jgi:hypothetical protein
LYAMGLRGDIFVNRLEIGLHFFSLLSNLLPFIVKSDQIRRFLHPGVSLAMAGKGPRPGRARRQLSILWSAIYIIRQSNGNNDRPSAVMASSKEISAWRATRD